MKNIPPSILPNFYGTSTEDPDAFLFEFDVLCRTYGYTDDTQKLRLFPTTLKGAILKWFMGLGVNTIVYWIDMKNIFLKKYQPYCQTRDPKDDIFRMTQHEDENLEGYLERFLYNLQKSKQRSLNSDTIKTIFLKGIRDEYINVLNLMGAGDISFLPFDQISELCRKYSRGKAKTGKDSKYSLSKVSKSAIRSVTRVELGNLLENFKTDLLSTLRSQIDTLQVKKKKEEQEPILSIFCSKCRNNHPLRDCLLDSIQLCGFCLETHSVEHYPTLQCMKVSQKGEAEAESLCSIAPRRPWQPRTSGMYQECMQSFPQYHNQVPMQNIPNTHTPWKSWSTPQTQNQPFQQGWRGPVSGNKYAPQQFYPSPYPQQYFNYQSSYQNPSHYQQPYLQQQQQFNPYP